MASLETLSIAGTTNLEETHCKENDDSTIREDITSLWDSKLLCDVTIRVNGVEFEAHRMILFFNSPFFRNMFTCETSDKNESVVELKRTNTVYIDPASFETLLRYMYTSTMKLNASNVLGVLRTAEYLGMEEPKQRCFRYLSKVLNPRNRLALFKIGYYYNSTDLLQQSVSCIWDNLFDLHCGVLQLEPGEFSALLNTESDDDHTTTRNEEAVCTAVLQWVKYDQASRLPHLAGLMGKVDLKEVPSSVLCETLQEEKIVTSDDTCLAMFVSAIRPRIADPEKTRDDDTTFKTEAVVTFSVIDNFKEMEYTAKELSPPMFVRCVPWRLQIVRTRSNRIRMSLQCCYQHESKWSFYVFLKCRLISFKDRFTNLESSGGFYSFDSYNKVGGYFDVIDLSRDYAPFVAPDKTMTFQIYFKVDPISRK